MITMLGFIVVGVIGRSTWRLNKYENMIFHLENNGDYHVISENYEESGYNLNLDLLIVSYYITCSCLRRIGLVRKSFEDLWLLKCRIPRWWREPRPPLLFTPSMRLWDYWNLKSPLARGYQDNPTIVYTRAWGHVTIEFYNLSLMVMLIPYSTLLELEGMWPSKFTISHWWRMPRPSQFTSH